MKVAVISDIHGNMEAIDAVMDDIEKRKCDKIFVLGDYAMAGPEPNYAIDYFMNRSNNQKYTLIQGNTDLMIADYSDKLFDTVKQNAPIMAEALKNDVERINPIQKKFLKNLPIQKEVQIEDVKFLLVHGSPRKNNEDILPDTPLDKVVEMLVNVDADVVLCGHTHIPCGFQTPTKKTVVNAGSVGRPFFVPYKSQGNKEPMACYLTIDVNGRDCEFQHHFVDYDKKNAFEKMKKRTFNGADKLAGMLLNPEVRHF